MLIQILLRKPNSWLVAANAATLALGALRMLLYQRAMGGRCPTSGTLPGGRRDRANLDLKYIATLALRRGCPGGS